MPSSPSSRVRRTPWCPPLRTTRPRPPPSPPRPPPRLLLLRERHGPTEPLGWRAMRVRVPQLSTLTHGAAAAHTSPRSFKLFRKASERSVLRPHRVLGGDRAGVQQSGPAV